MDSGRLRKSQCPFCYWLWDQRVLFSVLSLFLIPLQFLCALFHSKVLESNECGPGHNLLKVIYGGTIQLTSGKSILTPGRSHKQSQSQVRELGFKRIGFKPSYPASRSLRDLEEVILSLCPAVHIYKKGTIKIPSLTECLLSSSQQTEKNPCNYGKDSHIAKIDI